MLFSLKREIYIFTYTQIKTKSKYEIIYFAAKNIRNKWGRNRQTLKKIRMKKVGCVFCCGGYQREKKTKNKRKRRENLLIGPVVASTIAAFFVLQLSLSSLWSYQRTQGKIESAYDVVPVQQLRGKDRIRFFSWTESKTWTESLIAKTKSNILIYFIWIGSFVGPNQKHKQTTP